MKNLLKMWCCLLVNINHYNIWRFCSSQDVPHWWLVFWN